ncbi:protoheme IX farnesyltransferase [mine drainage metagenome]|uniref:Protoheme IX farnesyltransferase n=1 Tax=mine drainage metagenome TaxID=410659 RepID=A0A1J5Q930_9ZZZZ
MTSRHLRLLTRVRAYVALTKPRIIELLLVTTLPTMILAGRRLPGFWLALATLIGGTLAAGSANALNSYLDRDIDAVMLRTAHRPLAQAHVEPERALVFGILVGIASLAWLTILVNVLAAALSLAAILFYVFIYTMGLKRRTSSNIVWGGAAGSFPVLIGWAAVNNSLSMAPVVLFMLIFFWTPPHYWPLAMKYRDDYARAKIPMLPVVASDTFVAKRIIQYSWVMVAVSLALTPVAKMGLIYTITAVILGGAFLFEAYALQGRVKKNAEPREMRLFPGSISYLSIIFLAVAIDPLIHF